MNKEQAEEYTQSLAQVLGGGWRQILLAKKLNIPETLGMTVKDWVSTRLGGYLRHSVEERQEAAKELKNEGLSLRESAEVLGVDPMTVHHDLRAVESSTEDASRTEEDDDGDVENSTLVEKDIYDVLVIDPPWPMKKIDRNVRVVQHEFAYETMSEDQLLRWEEASDRAGDDCHVFLWTTQKFLPLAIECLKSWQFKYVCTFTWMKPGGFQVVGLPQYNTEFCLYARKGAPKFIDTKAFSTGFCASRGDHSEKPEEFYATLRRVTTGKRLDMFNRRKIEGFTGWGKESPDGI